MNCAPTPFARAVRLAASLLIAGWVGAALALDTVRISFEEGTVLSRTKKRGIEHPAISSSGGASRRDFNFIIAPGTRYQAWLTDAYASEGRRSLALSVSADDNRNTKDKVQFNIVSLTDRERPFVGRGGGRFLALDFMLDPAYETPSGWALHLQAWQCCGGHPPFLVRVVPSNDKHSPVQFAFVVRDDYEEETNPSTTGGKTLHQMTVPRGAWQTMVVQLDPTHSGEDRIGGLGVWMNGVKVVDYRGHWGYAPGGRTRKGGDVTADMLIGIGTYRKRQTTRQTIYVDNIRFGGTFASVME